MALRGVLILIGLAAGGPALADPVAVPSRGVAGPPTLATYSLAPGRSTLKLLRVKSDRYGHDLPSEGIRPEVRDRFDVRALAFEVGSQRRRRETMTAGLQLRLVGDAGGVDTSLDMAGPASAILRQALR